MKERQRRLLDWVENIYWAFVMGVLPRVDESQTHVQYEEEPLSSREDSKVSSIQFGKGETGRIARRSMRRPHPSGRTGRRT